MTLRDYFAAKAMQALIARGYPIAPPPDRTLTAFGAYAMADEMLKAREQ